MNILFMYDKNIFGYHGKVDFSSPCKENFRNRYKINMMSLADFVWLVRFNGTYILVY